MAPKNPPCTVFVPKPFSMPYAEAMGRLHQWLDRRKLQATGFKSPLTVRSASMSVSQASARQWSFSFLTGKGDPERNYNKPNRGI
jgi:hypothetical protein